eukprot:TRINITY_DN65132_c0_g1_i1.p1 TRINITY_DN65132_c0_g1~~TRINITY_DN65132_c0_g1_i1.p1  ORF type:complete len:1234 (-),score=333.58 TRINITY_DN65132_c0_g1_i1:96-3797(-)
MFFGGDDGAGKKGRGWAAAASPDAQGGTSSGVPQQGPLRGSVQLALDVLGGRSPRGAAADAASAQYSGRLPDNAGSKSAALAATLSQRAMDRQYDNIQNALMAEEDFIQRQLKLLEDQLRYEAVTRGGYDASLVQDGGSNYQRGGASGSRSPPRSNSQSQSPPGSAPGSPIVMWRANGQERQTLQEEMDRRDRDGAYIRQDQLRSLQRGLESASGSRSSPNVPGLRRPSGTSQPRQARAVGPAYNASMDPDSDDEPHPDMDPMEYDRLMIKRQLKAQDEKRRLREEQRQYESAVLEKEELRYRERQAALEKLRQMEEKERRLAVTKIQAILRGRRDRIWAKALRKQREIDREKRRMEHRVKWELRRREWAKKEEQDELLKRQQEKRQVLKRLEDLERKWQEKAAMKVQALWRGHQARSMVAGEIQRLHEEEEIDRIAKQRHMTKQKEEQEAWKKEQERRKGRELAIRKIQETEMARLNKAAARIQAQFRAQRTRYQTLPLLEQRRAMAKGARRKRRDSQGEELLGDKNKLVGFTREEIAEQRELARKRIYEMEAKQFMWAVSKIQGLLRAREAIHQLVEAKKQDREEKELIRQRKQQDWEDQRREERLQKEMHKRQAEAEAKARERRIAQKRAEEMELGEMSKVAAKLQAAWRGKTTRRQVIPILNRRKEEKERLTNQRREMRRRAEAETRRSKVLADRQQKEKDRQFFRDRHATRAATTIQNYRRRQVSMRVVEMMRESRRVDDAYKKEQQRLKDMEAKRLAKEERKKKNDEFIEQQRQVYRDAAFEKAQRLQEEAENAAVAVIQAMFRARECVVQVRHMFKEKKQSQRRYIMDDEPVAPGLEPKRKVEARLTEFAKYETQHSIAKIQGMLRAREVAIQIRQVKMTRTDKVKDQQKKLLDPEGKRSEIKPVGKLDWQAERDRAARTLHEFTKVEEQVAIAKIQGMWRSRQACHDVAIEQAGRARRTEREAPAPRRDERLDKKRTFAEDKELARRRIAEVDDWERRQARRPQAPLLGEDVRDRMRGRRDSAFEAVDNYNDDRRRRHTPDRGRFTPEPEALDRRIPRDDVDLPRSRSQSRRASAEELFQKSYRMDWRPGGAPQAESDRFQGASDLSLKSDRELRAMTARAKQDMLDLRRSKARHVDEANRLKQLLDASPRNQRLCHNCDLRMVSLQSIGISLRRLLDSVAKHYNRPQVDVTLQEVVDATEQVAHLDPQIAELAAYLPQMMSVGV